MLDEDRFLIDLSESVRTNFGKVDFAEQSEPQRVFLRFGSLKAKFCSQTLWRSFSRPVVLRNLLLRRWQRKQ